MVKHKCTSITNSNKNFTKISTQHPKHSRLVPKGLDRLSIKRVRPVVRTIHLRAIKLKRIVTTRRARQVTGAIGRQAVLRVAALNRVCVLVRRTWYKRCLKHAYTRVKYLLAPQRKIRKRRRGGLRVRKYKYRLKGVSITDNTLQRKFRARPVTDFKYWRRQYYRTVVKLATQRKQHQEWAVGQELYANSRLRRIRSPRRPARAPYRPRWKIKKKFERPKLVFLEGNRRQLLALRYARDRAHPNGFNTWYNTRWWLKKRLPKTRRRRGNWQFAGIFGHARWRRARKDKIVVRRQQVRFPLKRGILRRTVSHLTSLCKIIKRQHLTVRQALQACGRSKALFSLRPIKKLASTVARPRKRVRWLRRPHPYTAIRWSVFKRRVAVPIYRKRNCRNARRLRARFIPVDGGLTRRTLNVEHVSTTRWVYQPRSLQLRHKQKLLRRRQLMPQYSKWQLVARLRKLQTQRRLRSSLASKNKPTHLKFSRSTLYSAVHTNSQLTPSELAYPTSLTYSPEAALLTTCGMKQQFTVPVVRNLGLKSLLRPLSAVRVGFLQRQAPAYVRLLDRTPRGAFSAAVQRWRHRELRLYHRRPPVRLPNTMVTRHRRRKGGLVAFTRNSLKRPRTLRGRQNQLLPPAIVHSVARATYELCPRITHNVLFASTTRDDNLPRFWKRPPTRANMGAINRVRRLRFTKLKRANVMRSHWLTRLRHIELNTASTSKVLRILAKDRTQKDLGVSTVRTDSLGELARTLCTVDANKNNAVASVVAKALRPTNVPQGTNHVLSKSPVLLQRTMLTETPALSRTTEVTKLMLQHSTRTAQKVYGLWQVRSASNMLRAERALSAWVPQMSVRNRRRHSPRIGGVPLPHQWLSFREKRERRLLNARLLARNIPQRRYIDYAPIKLQYYYGSVGSNGYTRFRRVHRAHSKHSRWWRPNKSAVPFAHPLSRRALNSVHYRRLDLAHGRAPRLHTIGRLLRHKCGVTLHSKFPPRLIPWRNFRYRSPRYKRPPSVLQRWTFVPRTGKTGRSAPKVVRSVVKRIARELRALEQRTTSRNVWRGRRWATLDIPSMLTGNAGSLLFSAVRSVPSSVWQTLQERAGSPAAYAKLQQDMLEQFRHWVRKEQRVTTKSIATSFAAAQLFLTTLIASKLEPSTQKFPAVVHFKQQHTTLRALAFDKKTDLKATQFLRLRTLSTQDNLSGVNILSRERSGLYRRWLRGVEGSFKRPQLSYTPTSRSRYASNVALAFGRRRVRFPASGRRWRSYDSLLHAFVKKAGISRLRRASLLRFKQASPRPMADYRENLLAKSVLYGVQRRQQLSRKLSQVSYLAIAWRELVGYRIASKKGESVAHRALGGKRRFLSLPISALNAERAFQSVRLVSPQKKRMRIIRAGILRRALRRRRKERSFVDLRRSVLQRRLPKEAASRPWKLHRILQRRQAAKVGPYSRANINLEHNADGRWTLVHLSAVGRRYDSLTRAPLPPILISGEDTAVVKHTAHKDKRAFRNFLLSVNAPKRQKLRRQRRDSCKRRRLTRRRNQARRAAITRNTKHWSERKDSHLRNARFYYKHTVFAQRAACDLVGKLTTSCRLRVRSTRILGYRLAQFAAREQERNNTLPVSSTARQLTATALLALTSLNRCRRAHKLLWIKRPPKAVQTTLCFRNKNQHWRFSGNVKSRTERRKYISRRVVTNWSRVRRVRAAKYVFRAVRKPSIINSLVALSPVENKVTSLYFQKPTARVVKSEVTKEQEVLADIDVKEGRYKLTAQYVESLTTFIPEFMNQMLSRKLKGKKHETEYTLAQQTIRNIYWSLRVYLNVDPLDTRFFVRDRRPAARLRLFETISDLSESQRTQQSQRTALRYRFQPSKILAAPNTMRFRNDWLRTFFPAKHALYQESAEDYGKFLLSTHRIRRLRIGALGVASWTTAQHVVGLETRARQLLTLQSSRRRRRFETVLQTTRRVSDSECIPLVSVATSRQPFFQRHFSTYSERGPAIASQWIQRKKRFIANTAGWRTLTPVTLMAARSRALSRAEARGRTNYVATDRPTISNSFLDARFTRAKSSRSRQYLLRTPKAFARIAESKKFANLIFYRKYIQQSINAFVDVQRPYWARSSRRSVAQGPVNTQSNPQARQAAYAIKRMQTAQNSRFTQRLPYVTPGTVRRVIAKFQPAIVPISQAANKYIADSSMRSRAWYRTAETRTRRITSRRAAVLSQVAASVSRRFLYMRTKQNLRAKYLMHEFSFNDILGSIKLKKHRRRLRRSRLLPKSKIIAAPSKLVASAVSRQGVMLPNKKPACAIYFTNRARRHTLRNLAFSQACGLFTRFRRQVPFELHRPRLWDQLTLRWMKKHRIGRYWLRDASHWLRDPWLAEIVAPDASLRPDRFGGELRSRPQQIGEYVANVDKEGRNIKRKDASKERHKFQKVISSVKDIELKKTSTILKRGSVDARIVVRHRLNISRQARRKPVPTMRLANYEYRDAIREHKENKSKSVKQRAEEEQLRVKAYWARKAKNLPTIKARRLPLKHPANLWLPYTIWKDIQRRIRKFEWRESDEVFFRRGFRKAFQFYPNERRQAPWLEHLIYTRATFSTRLREFRRRQFPHEQKKFKWLQRVRKVLYAGRKRRYLKWRRWPQLRRYNQRLHYSLFKLRDQRAARRHFKRLAATSRPDVSSFVSMSRGLTNRLDVTCFQMGFAPSIYWARIVAEFGLLRVNGITVYSPNYQLKPNDVIYPNWDTVARFQHYFKPYLRSRENYQRRNRQSTSFYPTNLEYHKGTRVFVYKHVPDESDLRTSSRIRSAYFRWFKLDSCK